MSASGADREHESYSKSRAESSQHKASKQHVVLQYVYHCPRRKVGMSTLEMATDRSAVSRETAAQEPCFTSSATSQTQLESHGESIPYCELGLS